MDKSKDRNQKVLVLDIDGTLTNSEKEITKATRQGIIDIQERGHIVILASGRPTPGMKRYAEELELEKYGGYLLSFNGAKIINCKTKEIIFQQTLPSEVIAGIYHFATEYDCGIITYMDDYIVSGRRIDRYLELESRINNLPMKQVNNFEEYQKYDINKCLLTADPELAAQYEKKLQEAFKGVLSIYRSEPFFIEIMPLNIDKATSLDKMLASVGLTRENAICCGDGFNDMTMIQYAGLGVAMENAQPAVKEAADYITKSNDEDGIAHVIDKFIL